MNFIAINVRLLRGEMSLKNFAKRVGVTPEMISYIEKGVRIRPNPTLTKIAKVCGVEYGDLFAAPSISRSKNKNGKTV